MKHLAKSQTEEPVHRNGFRPYLKLYPNPDLHEDLQDVEELSPEDLRDLIRGNDEVEYLTETSFCTPFHYSLQPRDHCLPYFKPTTVHYDDDGRWYPEQTFYYLLRVDTGGSYDGRQYEPDRDAAERWRLMLMNDFPRRVRMAYVGPSDDAVYLLIQARLWGGGESGKDVEDYLEQDAMSMRNHIFRFYTQGEDAPSILVHHVAYAYVCHDPGVLYRPYIKTREEEHRELLERIREMNQELHHKQ